MKIYALILLFLGVPEAETPDAALQRLVHSVQQVKLVEAYEQLGEDGRAMVTKLIGRSARSLGLDPKTTTTPDILKRFEERFAAMGDKTMLQAFKAKIVSIEEQGDHATAKVQLTLPGKIDEVKFLFARRSGRWQIEGIDASAVQAKSNEKVAIATLRNITSAQAQFQASARADANNNGTGEYGFFGELSGAVEVRGGQKLNPPVLSTAFRVVDKGVLTRHGYYYRIFLCDADGKAVGEKSGTKGVDAVKAETTWCAYAWPIEYGKTGKRSFFVNQFGDVLTVTHDKYSGKRGPSADAAFQTAGTITGKSAIGAVGSDGQRWQVLR